MSFRWPSFLRWGRPTADRYFVTLFASQTDPKAMSTSHSFATFSRLTGTVVQHRTLSWLPVSLVVDPLQIVAQPGRNLSLDETLRAAQAFDAQVMAWGPFECTAKLYRLAMRKIDRLESGEILFVVIDQLIPRFASACNCIHALADLDPDEPTLSTGIAHGDAATLLILEHFRPHLIHPETTHRWVADSLNIPATAIHWERTPVHEVS